MALSRQELGRVLRYLDPKYKKAYEEGALSDDDLQQWGVDAGVLQADFSGVEGSTDTTGNRPEARVTPEAERRDMSGLLASLSGNPALDPSFDGGDTLAGLVASPAAREAFSTAAVSGGAGFLAGLQNIKGKLDVVNTDSPYLPQEERERLTLLQTEVDAANARRLEGLQLSAREGQKNLQALMGRMDEGATKEAIETGTDILSSPESFLSVLGPVGAATAITGQYARNLEQVNASGINDGRAYAYAAVKTLPSALELIPGRAGKAIQGNVDNLLSGLLGNILRKGAAEGVTEGIQSAAEMGIDKGLATYSEDEQVREYAKTQAPANTVQFFDNLVRSVRAGGVAGTAISTPGEVMQVFAEAGKRSAALDNIALGAAARRAARPVQSDTEDVEADMAPSTAITPTATQEDIFRTERIRNAEAQRLSIQNKVDTERQNVEEFQEAVEMGDRSPATLSAFALANRNLRQAEQLLSNQEQRVATMSAPIQTPAPVVETVPEVVQEVEQPSPERVAAREKERARIEKMFAKDEESAQKSAKSTRQAARRKFLKEQQGTMQDLPKTERVERLTDLALTWDDQNPLENFFKAPKAATPRVKTAEGVDENAADIDAASAIEDMRTRLRARTTREINTGVTTDQIVKELKGNVTSAGTGRIAGLAQSGNMEIVDTQDELSETAELEQQGKGFYNPETGKVIIIANTVDPANITGDILSTLAHEVKHAADRVAFVPSRPSLRNLVGEENNTAIVASIRELAEVNSPEGQRAADTIATVEASYPEELWAEEIPANYINTAIEADTGVMRDILSAVRTRYREATGNNNVNVKDIKYLANQLLREGAQAEGFVPEQGVAPFAMIVGKGHPRFEEFKKAGKVYTSRDGNEKFVLSDVESAIPVDRISAQTYLNGKQTTVDGIIDYPALYKAYPELRNIKIEVDPTLSDGRASYSERENLIRLAPSIMKEIVLFGDRGKGYLRSTVLHELQHAVQSIEGHALGGNDDMFMTTAEVAEERRYGSIIDQVFHVVNTLTHNKGNIAGLEDGTQNQLRQIGSIFGDVLDTSVVSEVMVTLRMDGGRYSQTLAKEIDNLITKREDMWPNIEKNRSRRNQEYHRLHGEIEAYWTGRQRNLSQEEISPFPEDRRDAEGFVGSGIQQSDEVILQMPSGDRTRIMAQVIPTRNIKIGNDLIQQSQVKRAAKRLLLPSGGFEPQLNEILRHGSNLPASLAIEGTHLGNQLLTTMKRNVADSNGKLTQESIRTIISARMDKIDELPTRAERLAAVNGLDREFPGVGAAINGMREFKIGFTDELLVLRLRDPKPLTAKENAVYEKMVSNAERYTTRAYLATYNEKVGKDYAKRMMTKYENDPDSKEGKIVQEAINHLVNNELLIPDTDSLHIMPMPQLRRLYNSYFGDVDKFKGSSNREIFVNRLEAIDPSSIAELETKALEIVRDMLGLNDSKGNVARSLQGSQRQNRTILESRTDMPEPLRKLLGEITDPFLRESISLHRMINLVSKTKVLTEIFEQGQAAGWWSDTRTPKHSRQLNSINYGPLEGKWISQDVADAITGSILGLNSIDSALADMAKDPDAIAKLVAGAVLPGMHRIMSIQKTWTVVASVANMIFNLGGAIVVGAPTQGIFNPVSIKNAMRDTAATLVLEVSDRYTTDIQIAIATELVRAGVTDSATMGEFRSQAYQAILKEILKISPDNKNYGLALAKAVWKGASGQGNIANTLRQVYAFMDVWTKVATYQDRKQFWTKFNEVEGSGLTTEEIERRAGYEAAGTNVSYERAIPLAKILERNIPVAMFLTYFSEVPRALTMSFVQAGRDFQTASRATTPEGRALAFDMGLARLIGTTAATVGITAATYAALDSEDDEEKRKRELDAPWMKNQVLIPIGVNKDGNVMYISLNRFDPWGPYNEPIMSILRAPEGERPEAAVTAVKDLFVQSKGVLAATKLVVDAVAHGAAYATGSRPPDWKFLDRKKGTIMERNYPQAYHLVKEYADLGGDVGENMVEAIESLFVPAVFAPVLDKERSRVAEVREDDVPVLGKALRISGGKAYVRDPDKSLFFRMLDNGDDVKSLRSELKEVMEGSRFSDAGSMMDDFARITNEERQSFNRLQKAYDGHLAFDKRNHNTAAEALGDRNKKLAARLRSGNFKPTVITADKLNDWYKDAVKLAETKDDKAELKQRYDLMKKVLIDSRSTD